MRLVVDTNRLMAALIRDSVSRRIRLSPLFEFHTVDLLRQEIAKHQAEIAEKSSLQLPLFYRLADSLFTRVPVVNDTLVRTFLPQAQAAMDSVDPDDAPFLAAALAVRAASGRTTATSSGRTWSGFSRRKTWLNFFERYGPFRRKAGGSFEGSVTCSAKTRPTP